MSTFNRTAAAARFAAASDADQRWSIATAPVAEYRREARANLAASIALRAVAAGLPDDDVRVTMLDQADSLQMLAAIRGERPAAPAIDVAQAWERPEHAMLEAGTRLRRLAAELDERSGTRAHFLAAAERWLMRARLAGGALAARPWAEVLAFAELACKAPGGLRAAELAAAA